jgi:hypothetical protein
MKTEAFPVETTYPLFECPKGHRQWGSGETKARNNYDGAIVSSGPLCTACWMDSLGAQFPTVQIGEAPLPKDLPK